MPPFGGFLKRHAVLGLLVLSTSGCVQRAVLENDVRIAESRARVLATLSNLRQAEAALSAQLVELEALYQRGPSDARVLQLLSDGYELLATGFIEIRRWQAATAGDTAEAERERRDQADARARAAFYRRSLRTRASGQESGLAAALAPAAAACDEHDRNAYQQRLGVLLARVEPDLERRLEHSLTQRLAALWLEPLAAERCGFQVPASPSASAR